MPLSTLLSKRVLGWAGIALMTLAASAGYLVHLNPEMRFFQEIARKKQLWCERLSNEHGARVLVSGGSSCTFSIEGQRLLREHQLPAANLGLGAGMGCRVLTRFALSEAKSGDTVVLALEPTLLEEITIPSMGVQFSLAMNHLEWLDDLESGGRRYSRLGALLSLGPGGYHVFTLLGKIAVGRPLYRYTSAEVDASGWQQTPVRLPLLAPNFPSPDFSAEVLEWFRQLRAYCERHHLKLFYSLPWAYNTPEMAAAHRQANAKFLLAVSALVPVLKDPRLGVYTNASHFADTSWHLTPEATSLRTDELARQLKTQAIWTAEELTALAKQSPP